MVCERNKRKEPPFMRFPRNCFQSGLFEIFMLPSESDVGGLSYDLSIKKWFLEKNRFETRKPWPRRCKYLERQMEVTAVQDLGITESVIYLSHWMLPTQLDISLRLHSDDFLKLWRQLRKNGENGCFFFAFIPPIDQTTRAELYLSVMISRSISFPCCESPSAFILVRSAAQEVNPVHPSVILIEMVRPLETVCRTFRQKDTQMKSFIFGRISKISYPSLRVNIYRRSLHRNVESPLRVNCSRLQTCEHIHRTRPL